MIRWLYHCTDTKFVPSIMRWGLVPAHGKIWMASLGPMYDKAARNTVVGKRRRDAVLVVDVKGLKVSKVNSRVYVFRHTIPPERIRLLSDNELKRICATATRKLVAMERRRILKGKVKMYRYEVQINPWSSIVNSTPIMLSPEEVMAKYERYGWPGVILD